MPAAQRRFTHQRLRDRFAWDNLPVSRRQGIIWLLGALAALVAVLVVVYLILGVYVLIGAAVGIALGLVVARSRRRRNVGGRGMNGGPPGELP